MIQRKVFECEKLIIDPNVLLKIYVCSMDNVSVIKQKKKKKINEL